MDTPVFKLLRSPYVLLVFSLHSPRNLLVFSKEKKHTAATGELPILTLRMKELRS